MNALFLGFFCVVMLFTRYPFALDGLHVFDASWALFFLLGRLQFQRAIKIGGFVLLAALGWVIDVVAIDGAVVSGYCMTPAYLGMPIAYAALTWFGFLSQKLDLREVKAAFGLVCLSGLAGLTAFVITNGFFYLGSGYFADMMLVDYVSAVAAYLPQYLLVMQMYLLGWFVVNQLMPFEYRLISPSQGQQVNA